MSIDAVNYNNQASGLYDIFGINSTSAVDAVSGYRSGGSAEKTSTSGGDTVSISDEARELFARKTQMLRMDDEQTEQVLNLGAGNTTTTSERKATVDNGLSDEDKEAAGVTTGSDGGGESGSSGSADSVAASGGSGGGGGGGSESSSDDEDRQEELESQLQSLQSQLLGILSDGGDSEVNQVKAGPIQSQIRSVEAELQAMKSQATKSAKG